LDIWGGSTGNTPGQITASQLENAQVCYYGREPEAPTTFPVYDSEWGIRKFLALKYRIVPPITEINDARSKNKTAKLLAKKAKERVTKPKIIFSKRPRNFRVLPGQDEFENGKIYVVVKVYPKFE
jgi:hypothetical protein